MDVNLELYRIFYTVATCKSISKAANILYISQPAVTVQIKKLEEQIGVNLFNRTKHGSILTEEGKILYDYVASALNTLNNGENTLKNLKNIDAGIIRIGSSTTVAEHVLMPYLEKFHQNFPNIEIQIVNHLTEELLSLLRNGNLDMVILNLPMKESKDINLYKIMDVQDIFIGNEYYYHLTKGKVILQDLKKYPLLFQKAPSNTREFLDKYLKDNHVYLNPKIEIVSYNLIMEFVKIGFGIGYATREFIKEALKEKKLYEIEVKPKIPKRYIGIATMKKTIPNFSANKLIEMMTRMHLKSHKIK